MDDNALKGTLTLDENQPNGTLLLPGCRLDLEYKCESEGFRKVEADAEQRDHYTYKDHDYKEIFELLIEGFTDQDLRELVALNPKFQGLRGELPEGDGKKRQIALKITEFARAKRQTDVVLGWVRENDPGLYEEYESSKLRKRPRNEFAA